MVRLEAFECIGLPCLVCLLAMAALCGMDTALNADGVRMFISEFTDYMTVSKWARESMAFCFKAGILVSDEFEEDILPGQAITRGEVALMVYRLLLKAALL